MSIIEEGKQEINIYAAPGNSSVELSLEVNVDHTLQSLLTEANIYFGRLDASLENMQDKESFIQINSLIDYVYLSKLEGSEISLVDILKNYCKTTEFSTNNILEGLNYFKTFETGCNLLKESEINLSFIKQLHKSLLHGIIRHNKSPGIFRRPHGNYLDIENRIKSKSNYGNNLSNALTSFEQYIGKNTEISPLIKSAAMYYNFLKLHPFQEKNIKLASLLVNLYLYKHKLLLKPCLCLGKYNCENLNEFILLIEDAQDKNKLYKWTCFFLRGIVSSMDETINKIKKVNGSFAIDIEKTVTLGRTSKNCNSLLRHLLSKPLLKVKDVEAITGLKNPNALALITKLLKLNIVEEITGQKRNRIFIYKN